MIAVWKNRLSKALGTTVVVYLIASVLSRAGSVLLVPLYTRKLTSAEYGTYGLIMSAVAILPSCWTLGLNAAISKVYFDTPPTGDPRPRVGSIGQGIIYSSAFFAALS